MDRPAIGIQNPTQKAEDPARLPAPVLVDTPAAFEAFLAAVASAKRLALDTESDSLYRYFHKVCLIQVSTAQTDYLLDPLRIPDLQPLAPFMADAQIEKVFHAAENDILLLKRDFGFHFANVFDTLVAARILGRRSVGLAALLRESFGVELDKRMQLTDWGHRPLTPQQLSYARLDSHYLLPLRDLLADELQRRRRWREAQEAFAGLPDLEYTEKPYDPDGFWRSKVVRDLRPAELAVFRELYLWRDQQARALNQPPFKIVTDQVLAELSQRQPTRPADLGLPPRLVERFGPAILAAIARGRQAPAPQPPPRRHNSNGRPDPIVNIRYDRLRAWRARRAAERGVDPDIIMNNEALLAIARACPADLEALAGLGILGPWKLEEYGAELLAALAESASSGDRD